MFFVGIDIAKRSHEACVINQDGAFVVKPFKFTNDFKGFNKFLDTLKTVGDDFSAFDFGMEATGHYWLNLYCKLLDHGAVVHVINPVQSDALRGLYIRPHKNDSKDAFIIAELLRFGRYAQTSLSDPNLMALRELTRQRTYLVDCTSDVKRKVIALIDKVFPEYEQLFTDMFGSTSLQLLETYSTPDALVNIDTDDLAQFLSTASHGHFGRDKAEQVQAFARNTFGSFLFADSAGFAIKQFLEQIRLIERQVQELEVYIAECLAKFQTALTTIKGIGTTLAAVFVAEIGDVSRFPAPDKLAAFAGIEPRTNQSGEFSGTQNKMSKRGSPYLRRAFFQAAVACNMHNPALHAIYEKKRAQGKHHNVALSAVARKLVNIIFAVMKSNKPYEMIMPS